MYLGFWGMSFVSVELVVGGIGHGIYCSRFIGGFARVLMRQWLEPFSIGLRFDGILIESVHFFSKTILVCVMDMKMSEFLCQTQDLAFTSNIHFVLHLSKYWI